MKERKFVLKDFIIFMIVPIIIIGFVIYFWISNKETIEVVECRDVAKNVEKAAELYYDEQILDLKRFTTTNYDLDRDVLIFGIVGMKPDGGNIIITTDGDIAIASYYNGYCAIKDFGDKVFTISQMDEEECFVE